MTKYFIVNGGDRGAIETNYFTESELGMEDFVTQRGEKAVEGLIENFTYGEEGEDLKEALKRANDYINDYNIGEDLEGDLAKVQYDEESYEYIVMVTEENEAQLKEFAEDPNMCDMGDFVNFMWDLD